MNLYCKNGWTIILSRGQFGNPTNYFDRTWQNMEQPFGDPDKEFWIGLENLYNITNNREYVLKIEMEGANGVDKISLYHGFKILDTHYYTLDLGPFNTTLSTALNDFVHHDGQKFSTINVDNDNAFLSSCVANFRGPGW